MSNPLGTHAPLPDLTRIRLVLMDIDGTLVAGSELELENVNRQLSRLTRRRVRFSVATGRTIFGARNVVKSLASQGRLPLIIAYNGAVIASLDADPWIQRLLIDKSAFVALLRACRRLNLPLLVYTCKDSFEIKGNQEKVFAEPDLFANAKTEFNGMSITRIPDLEELVSEDVVAALISDPLGSGIVEDMANRLRSECGSQLRITSSGGKYVEIAHPKATKLHAMEQLCGRLGISVSEVMAIGDNYNDLEMLSACGFGVAVANSPSAVKKECRFVAQHNAARGVVEALISLVNAYAHDSRRRRVEQESR